MGRPDAHWPKGSLSQAEAAALEDGDDPRKAISFPRGHWDWLLGAWGTCGEETKRTQLLFSASVGRINAQMRMVDTLAHTGRVSASRVICVSRKNIGKGSSFGHVQHKKKTHTHTYPYIYIHIYGRFASLHTQKLVSAICLIIWAIIAC